MSSIFIWKTTRSGSFTILPYYNGPNWFQIGDNTCYKITNQLILNNVEIGNILVYKVKSMPKNWMETLLSVEEIEYELIKKDEYASLEQIGRWFYLTLHSPITFDILCIMNEWKSIFKWCSIFK